MFAPPNVSNAKAAQALQASALSQISVREQNQPSSLNVPIPGEPVVLREKSDPVLSQNAPNSVQELIYHDKEKEISTPSTSTTPDMPLSSQDYSSKNPSVDRSGSDIRDSLKENSSIDSQVDASQDSTASTPSVSLQVGSSSSVPMSTTTLGKKKNKKNRKSAWYNLISPTYKSKCEDFRRLFKDVPEGEMLIVDYSCALQRDILVHGRLYVTQNYLCFYANIFRWETTVVIKCKDITSMTKEKTALVIPNAIQCSTETRDRYFFTSFAARDKSYLMLFRLWQNALLKQPMSTAECWRWIHYSYGDELGLSTDDEDYIPPDDLATCRSIDIRSLTESPMEEAEMARPPSAAENSSTVSGLKTSFVSSSAVSDQELKTSSSDEQDVNEEVCPMMHDKKQYLDRIFAMDVDHAFTCLFTGSEFYQEFQTARRITNITIGNWAPSESIDFKQERALTYTVNTNIAMAKNCLTTEKQSLHRRSKPGKVYAVDCEFSNSGVAYADTFVINHHFCLWREKENRCRLRVYSEVEYRKPLWGFMKRVIERNTVQGINEFIADLQKELDKEAQRLAGKEGQSLLIISDGASPSSSIVEANPKTSNNVLAMPIYGWQRSLIIFLCVTVGVLLAFNVYLFHKSFYYDHSQHDLILETVPDTVAGWKSAYIKNQIRHRRQLEHLQRLMDRSLQGLENTRIVFTKIKDVIAQKVVALPNHSRTEL